MHADVVLVYMRESDWGDQSNPLSLLYLTIVGFWLVPGNNMQSMTVAQGALVDVRTGFVYGVVSADAEKRTSTPSAYSDATWKRLRTGTEREALDGLATETAGLITDLKNRLLRDLQTSRHADARPAARVPSGVRYETAH